MADIREDKQNSDFSIHLTSIPNVKPGMANAQGSQQRGYDFVCNFAEPLIIPTDAEVGMIDFKGLVINHTEGNQVRNQFLSAFIEVPELQLSNYMVMSNEGQMVKGSYLPHEISLPETPDVALVNNLENFEDEPFNPVYSPINNPEPKYLNSISVRIKTYSGKSLYQFVNTLPDLTNADMPITSPSIPAAPNGRTNVGGTSIILNIRQRK